VVAAYDPAEPAVPVLVATTVVAPAVAVVDGPEVDALVPLRRGPFTVWDAAPGLVWAARVSAVVALRVAVR